MVFMRATYWVSWMTDRQTLNSMFNSFKFNTDDHFW